MKYFIGHALGGEVKEYHEKIIDALSCNFRLKNLNEYIPAHFTIKSPFETKNIRPIERLVGEISSQKKKSVAYINGIDNFDKKIVYLKCGLSPESIGTIERLNDKLEKVDWMTFDEYDLVADDFHATLARVKNRQQLHDVMRFLGGENPFFEFEFDNITIFRKHSKKWDVYRKFELGQ